VIAVVEAVGFLKDHIGPYHFTRRVYFGNIIIPFRAAGHRQRIEEGLSAEIGLVVAPSPEEAIAVAVGFDGCRPPAGVGIEGRTSVGAHPFDAPRGIDLAQHSTPVVGALGCGDPPEINGSCGLVVVLAGDKDVAVGIHSGHGQINEIAGEG